MRGKFNDIFEVSSAEDYDLICLTETWLNDDFLNSDLFDNRYEIFRKDRDYQFTGLSLGGGVLIAAKKHLKARLVSHIDFSGEAVWVKICIDNYISVCVCCIYIPPSASNSILHEFYDVIDEYFSNINNLVIVGDFNLPFINWSDHKPAANTLLTHEFICFLQLHELIQYNNIVNFMNRILDLVLIKLTYFDASIIQPLSPITPEDRYHPALQINFNKIARISKCKHESLDPMIHTYNFKRANFDLLCTLLTLVDWNFLNNYDSINIALESFYSVLFEILDECIPKSKPVKKKYPTWFTGEIINNIKQKNIYLKKYRKHNNLNDLELYKHIRKKIKSDIGCARKSHIDSVEKSLKSNPKSFWSYFRNKNRVNENNVMFCNGDELTSDREVAEAFKGHFASIYTKRSENTAQDNVTDINLNTIDMVRIDLITHDDIERAVRQLKGSSSPGLDLIPPYIIKANKDNLIYPLLILFNLSLKTMVFPDIWKTTKIVPIFKKGNKSDIKNYRPIAIISSFAKVFESIICEKISNQTAQIISPYQHGFMKKRSTTTNLICLNKDISNALKLNKQLDIIYTDFAKAFDTVDFDVLFSKLLAIGFSHELIMWMYTYVVGRPLYVKFKSAFSDCFYNTSGVPQGSVLGPRLFLLFINDLSYIFNSCLLFADDLKIYRCISTYMDCEILQTELYNLQDWCNKNKLFLNIDKCFVLTFARKTNPLINNYSINNNLLSRKINIRDLGITYETNFSFNMHITEISTKANKKLGILKRTTNNFTDVSVIICLFNTIIRPLLEYGCAIWNPSNSYSVGNIEGIQNKFFRYINFKTNRHFHHPPYNLMRMEHKMNSLECRRVLSIFKFFYNLLHNRIDCPYILEDLKLYVPIYKTRNKTVFKEPFCSTNYIKNQPINQFIQLLNSLPFNDDIFCDNFRTFKSNIISLYN